ncbi:MAG TPA: hypothetical protein VFY80_10505, partial [Burkholderiales bacterium]|nr:hypothetical protein [Burkholderiales bacterium]
HCLNNGRRHERRAGIVEMDATRFSRGCICTPLGEERMHGLGMVRKSRALCKGLRTATCKQRLAQGDAEPTVRRAAEFASASQVAIRGSPFAFVGQSLKHMAHEFHG